MPNNQPFLWKICTGCGAMLIASKKNFRKDKSCKYGLGSKCKICTKEINRKYYQRPEIKEHRAKCREEYRKKPEVKERIRERKRKYRKTPEGKFKHCMEQHKRNEKKRQGNGIQSYEIAQEILNEWFLNTCAYSGIKLTNDILNWDHIIPLAKNGVNEIWNLVPSYCKYNQNKNAKEPYKWYKEQKYYDEDRLEYIIYYQKVMYWNFANKDTEPLILITGEKLTYEEVEEEFGVCEGAN